MTQMDERIRLSRTSSDMIKISLDWAIEWNVASMTRSCSPTGTAGLIHRWKCAQQFLSLCPMVAAVGVMVETACKCRIEVSQRAWTDRA